MLWVLILLHGGQQAVESTDLLQDWEPTSPPSLGAIPFYSLLARISSST